MNENTSWQSEFSIIRHFQLRGVGVKEMRRPTANEPQSRNSGLGKPQIIPFFPLQEGGIFFK